ncbi:MAG TPA: galactose-1-phosphate uridylyltransferase [Jatrophihabitantaceae bacterium]|jgi:UDPglucose--hexose-1-phosphate uridylyltransferase
MTFRQSTKLADGRELFYYDEQPGVDRSTVDGRDLPATATSSQIRWDPLFREWSIIAGHRQTRTYRPPTSDCPLDPSRDGRLTEIPADDYDVVVFENRFPSLTTQASDDLAADEFPFRSAPGLGRCEVVCFTSDHDTSFGQLRPSRARTVFDALADRTSELSRIDGVEYVFCFENRGEEIGVTLSHPHGQIYAYPFVPSRFERAADAARAYHDQHDSCLQCAVVAAERKTGIRVVAETELWTAHVPYSARWPYEVRIVPHRHVPDLPALSDDERDDLAGIYLDVLQRFDRLFGGGRTPYISGWQQSPVHRDRDVWHLAAEVFTIRRAPGKLKYLAGSESGAGVWINDVTPEVAAARLRGE